MSQSFILPGWKSTFRLICFFPLQVEKKVSDCIVACSKRGKKKRKINKEKKEKEGEGKRDFEREKEGEWERER